MKTGRSALLTSALDGSKWPASFSALYTPGERALGDHRIGYLMDSRTRMDVIT